MICARCKTVAVSGTVAVSSAEYNSLSSRAKSRVFAFRAVFARAGRSLIVLTRHPEQSEGSLFLKETGE